MERLSKRMVDAGWVLQSVAGDHWELIAPEGRRFDWKQGKWSPSREEAEAQLLRDEAAVAAGQRSRFVGTARLLACTLPGGGTLLSRRIAEDKRCEGHSVLRVLPLPDPLGDTLLLDAGARRVESLLAPWGVAPDDSRRFPHHLLLCEHVCDVLPPEDRSRVLRNLPSYLHPQGEAYFSFYEMSALPPETPRRSYQDGYVFNSGCHELFLKPWLPARAMETLHHEIGGNAATAWSLYDEFVLRWIPAS